MRSTIHTAAGLTAALALIVTPAGALADSPSAKSSSSDSIATAVNQVRAHTDRADAALDRAVSNFAKGKDSAARSAYAKSRREMASARADAAKALRQADTPRDHVRAASAQERLAAQQDENIETLAGALRKADGRDESKIAAAARAETKGREKAISVLTGLLTQVPEQARTGIATAIAELSQDRTGEVREMERALRSSNVSETNKRRVMSALSADVAGQTDAASILAALIASPDMPAESKQGLQTAYDKIAAEHGSTADILSRFPSRMPSFVRDFLGGLFGGGSTPASGPVSGLPIPGGLPIPSDLPVPSGLPIPSDLPIPSGLPIPGFLNGGR